MRKLLALASRGVIKLVDLVKMDGQDNKSRGGGASVTAARQKSFEGEKKDV